MGHGTVKINTGESVEVPVSDGVVDIVDRRPTVLSLSTYDISQCRV